MSRYLDRDARLALQTHDDGAPTDEVTVNTGTKVTSYHDDPTCSRVRHDTPPERITRKAA